MDLKLKETELATLVNQAKTLYAENEAKGAGATAEDREKLERLIADGQMKRKELDMFKELELLDTYTSKGAAESVAHEMIRNGGHSQKSWGRQVLESPEFKNVTVGAKEMAPAEVKVNPIVSDASLSGGLNIFPQRMPDIYSLIPQRPPSIIDLVTTMETSSSAIQYVTLTARTNNAAVVPEYASGQFGLKPQSDLTFALNTALVKTIAAWVASSNQILEDAPRLRDTIDTDLTYMVQLVLENQIIAGDGTGNNFLGITNTPGIQVRTMGSSGRGFLAGDTKADTLRRAITDIQLQFYTADGIAINPADHEAIELLKATTNEYVLDGDDTQIYDPVRQVLWRVPLVATPAVPALTAIVGNFRLGATLWNRMQSAIRVGQPNDFFLRNAIAILAELRAAFAVTRPLAFEKVTLV